MDVPQNSGGADKRSLQAASAEPRSGDPSFKIKEMIFISLTFVKSQNHPSFQTICLILVKNKSEHYIHNYPPHHHDHPYPHHHHAFGISKQASKFTVGWKQTV